jgi:dGTP triphosphohydrolase
MFYHNFIALESTLSTSCQKKMRTRFYQASAKHPRMTQGVKKKPQRPKLSKEARAALNARRRLAAKRYKDALGETWNTIDKLTEEIAASHHKSVRHVQTELHTGLHRSHTERTKTSAWNAFTWKKSQEKENSELSPAQ